MGARFSKVSCTCTIDCHQPGVVHDHSNGVGPCQRCNQLRRLRAGAQSRASAASTSTEYLARPRYHTSPSPDPDLARRLIPHPRSTLAHPQRRARHRRRAVSLPSFVSTTTSGLTSSSNPAPRTPSLRLTPSPIPSPTPSPAPSTSGSLSILSNLTIPGARARRNTVAAGFVVAGQSSVGYANANRGGGGPSASAAAAAIEASAPTASNISQSSTAMWRGTEGAGPMVVYTGEGGEGEEEEQSDWGFWA